MNEMTPKVRLVKCPKCRNVLQESADIPVYSCGGCNTILQAKYGKKNAQNIRSGSQDPTDAPRDTPVQGLEESKVSNSLKNEIAIPSSEEHSPYIGNDRGNGTLNESSNINEERSEVPNGIIISSPELVEEEENRDVHTNGEISPVARAESQEEEPNNGELNEEREEVSKMSVPHRRMMSEETFASTEYVDPCSEFNDTDMGDSFRYQTTIQGIPHPRDGRVSSFGQLHNFTKDEDKNKSVSSETLETLGSPFHSRFSSAYQRNRELPPKIPVCRRAPKFLYEDEGSSSSYQTSHYHVPENSSYDKPRSPEGFVEEDDKLRLLEIVYELEDQLKKACRLDRIDERRRNNPWASRKFGFSKIPFSAETSRSAYRLDYSQGGPRQRSEPLPPPHFHNKGIHSLKRWDFYGPYRSWPSSPQDYTGMESEFSAGSRNPSHELQKLRKDNIPKRHMRPVGGAMPFMACYHCSEILHLPEDSFVLRKRGYRLRCGACSTVLKLSIENGTRIVPYEPEARVPPPSEAEDERGKSIDARKLYTGDGEDEIDEAKFDARDIRSSPLHELMGYSSVSQVFRGARSWSRRRSP